MHFSVIAALLGLLLVIFSVTMLVPIAFALWYNEPTVNIFLTAFAFLNMVIGIVVSVVEEEHQRIKQQTNPEPTMQDLQDQIAELKLLLMERQK